MLHAVTMMIALMSSCTFCPAVPVMRVRVRAPSP